MNMAKLMEEDAIPASNSRSKSELSQKSEYIKFAEGNTIIRLLPGTPELDGKFWVKQFYHTHQVQGRPDKVQCTKESEGRCWICDYIHPNAISPIKEVKDSWFRERGKPRFYFNVLDRTDGKVKVWEASKTIYEMIKDIVSDPDYGDITNVETGRDITVTRKGTGLDTTYTILPKPKVTALENSAAILAQRHPIHLRLKPINQRAQQAWWMEGYEAAKKIFDQINQAKQSVNSDGYDDSIPF